MSQESGARKALPTTALVSTCLPPPLPPSPGGLGGGRLSGRALYHVYRSIQGPGTDPQFKIYDKNDGVKLKP